MLPRPGDILGLEWDEENEEHLLGHIDAWLVEELIEGHDWMAFPNTRGQPPEHVKVIGRTESGMYVTVILRPPREYNPGFWWPVTGWMATDYERERFRAARGRKG